MNARIYEAVRLSSENICQLVQSHQNEPLSDPTLKATLHQRLPITQQSKAWHAARDCHITASDVAAVLATNPYCNKYQVCTRKMQQYLKLKRQLAGTPSAADLGPVEKTNFACQWGIDHESEAAALYSYVTGIPLYCDDIGLLIHPTVRCVGATPDALARHQPLLIEIKAPFKRAIKHGQIPAWYYPQVQVQMEICNVDVCHFVQYSPARSNARGILDILEIKRDKEWWTQVEPKLVQFWKEVIESATGDDYSNEAIDAMTKTIVEGEPPPPEGTVKYNWRWPPDGRYTIAMHGLSIPVGAEFQRDLISQQKLGLPQHLGVGGCCERVGLSMPPLPETPESTEPLMDQSGVADQLS